MKQKSFTQVTAIILSVLMIAGLIFPNLALQAQTTTLSATEDTGQVIFTGSNPNQLRELLASEGEVILATDRNLGIFEQYSPFVIEENTRLIIQTALNIHRYAELIILGDVVVLYGGRLNNQGVGTTITVGETGVLFNFGHVENVSGSTFNNNGLIINDNRFEVRAGVFFNDFGRVEGFSPINIHRNAVVTRPTEPPYPPEPPIENCGPRISFASDVPHGEVGDDSIFIRYEAFVDPGYYIARVYYTVNGRSNRIISLAGTRHEFVNRGVWITLDVGANEVDLLL